MRNRRGRVLVAVLVALGWAGRAARGDEVVAGKHSVVIAGHPLATKVGMDVLNSGGSAADALVATSLTLGVVEPMNSGLGGKFVLLYYEAKTKKVTCIAGMGAAPLGLSKELAAERKVGDKSRGWTVPCTPGLPAALGEVHKRWGTRAWAGLVAPAAKIAHDGFSLNERAAEMFDQFPLGVDEESTRLYAPGGKHPKAGAVLKNPDLAKTLRLVASGGVEAFYRGEPAKRVAAAARANGGFLSEEDFAKYRVRVLTPLEEGYHGYQVYSSPPPLTGGSTVLMTLGTIEGLDWGGARPRSASYIDTFSRALAQVHPVVSATAGDVPGSYEKVAEALSADNVKKLAQRARETGPTTRAVEGASTSMVPAAEAALLDDGLSASTTHLLVIDSAGNIACCTQSLGLHFGSAVVAPGTGFLLNGDIGNFTFSSPRSMNAYAPGKWPRSTMAPTIVLKQGRPVMAIGSPAGARIPTVVLQVMVDVLDFHLPLDDAIRAPRFHLRRATGNEGGRGATNVIDLEAEAPAGLDGELEGRGWKVQRRKLTEFYFGSVNAAVFNADGTVTGVADQRRTADAGGN